LYGDQYRSPGRDDRHDGPGAPQAPWEAAPASPEDVKVAGAPTGTPPGFYDAGVYDDTAHETTAYDTGAPGPDGNATTAYDMGDETVRDAPLPYDLGAASAAPPFTGDGQAPGPDFEDMRRTPRASHKRLIKFAAAAAAVAVVGGGGVAWAVTGGSSADKAPSQKVQAQAPPPAPLTDAQRKDIAAKRRKELTKRASRAARNEVVRPRLLAKGTPPPKPTKSPAAGTAGDPVPASEAQRIARSLMPSYGWSPSSQFGCTVNLWNRESGWNVHAANPSGAYGIPQAKPGSKMASAGPDWQNNATTQIKWGYGYIKSRYGTPCAAWAHSQSSGWY
jgi:hypothetical protein